MDCSTPGIPVLHRLLELGQTHVHCVTEAIQPSVLCRSLLLLPSIFPRVFSNELAFIRKLQYFGHLMALTSVLPMNIQGWCPLGLIFFQSKRLSRVFSNNKYNLKPSVLQHSAFFMVQLSCPFMTTGEFIALTIQTFVGKVRSLLFKTPFRYAVAFFPRSKYLFLPITGAINKN